MSVLRNLHRKIVLVRHGRGFGVHSPLAYELIRFTLRDNPAYYADAGIKKVFANKRQQRIARIIVRLCARFKPLTIYVCPTLLPVTEFLGNKICVVGENEDADLKITYDNGVYAAVIGAPGENRGPIILDNCKDLKIIVHRKGLSRVTLNTKL